MTDVVLRSPIVPAVGVALVQFLWQGALIALVAAAALAVLRRRSPQARYLVACSALAAMMTAPVATVVSYLSAGGQARAAGLLATTIVDVGGTPSHAGWSALGRALAAFDAMAGVLPIVVAVWFAGVLILTLRLLRGWLAMRMLTRRAIVPVRDAWSERLRLVACRLGVARDLRLIESLAVDVPAVIGWLRPIIVVPTCAFSGLSPSQLEAILAHEVAHIRRHDFVVNFGQSVVETLLFYHPAVWWMSNRIRRERELCCDDAAVALCGDRVAYAGALALLEELRVPIPSLALAATGGHLIDRIRRLLGVPVPASDRTPAWMVVGLVLGLAVLPAMSGRAAKMESRSGVVPVGARAGARLQTGPLRVGGAIAAPPRLRNVAPVYPALARAAHQQGIVFLEATIDEQGDVTAARVLRSAAPLLDQAAVDAVMQWEYVPTMLNGVPVPVIMTVTINFSLPDSTSEMRSTGQPPSAPPPLPPPPPDGATSQAVLRSRLEALERQYADLASQEAAHAQGGDSLTLPPDALWVDDLAAPKKISSVVPIYPAEARAAGVEGLVVLAVVVDTAGNVASAEVIRSAPLLDQAALDAVTQWKYVPTLINGVPRPIVMTVTVNFTLQ